MSVQKAIAGRTLIIPLSINVERSKLMVRVTSVQDEKNVHDPEIVEKSPNNYEIRYTPSGPGDYKMEIFVSGNLKQTVSIRVDASPSLRILGPQQVNNAIVGQQVEFKFEYPSGTLKAEQIEVSFVAEKGSGNEAEELAQLKLNDLTSVVGLPDGKFSVRFTPPKPGRYTSKVVIHGAGTMDGQLVVEASAAPKIQLIEGASGLAIVGKPFTFKLSAPGVSLHQISVSVKTPTGSTDTAKVFTAGDNTFDIVYTPATIGKFQAEIKLDGGLISAPLTIDSRTDFKWSNLPFVKGELLSGKEFDFNLELQHETDSLSLTINDAHHNPVHLGKFTHVGPNSYSLKWKPPSGGYYDCQLFLEGKPLGDAVTVYATEPKAETGGKNISKGTLGNTFSAVVKLEDIQHKKVDVVVKDKSGHTVGGAKVEAEGTGSYKISFKPEKIGLYTCSLVLDGVSVSNSELFFDVHD